MRTVMSVSQYNIFLLTLCVGLHDRLGAGSLLSFLDDEVLRQITASFLMPRDSALSDDDALLLFFQKQNLAFAEHEKWLFFLAHSTSGGVMGGTRVTRCTNGSAHVPVGQENLWDQPAGSRVLSQPGNYPVPLSHRQWRALRTQIQKHPSVFLSRTLHATMRNGML